MKDLVIYIPEDEKIVRICEGDGCNLSSEDKANDYVDYLYYDVFDPQNLQDVDDGGMVLLKKPIKEEFNSIQEVVNRVCEMIGYAWWSECTVLSGLDEWYNYLKKENRVYTKWIPAHSCSTCKHSDKKITEEPCLDCDIRVRNDKWEARE